MKAYNLVALVWSIATVYSGVRYADGNKSGPLSFWGGLFDYVFGLDTCRTVPTRNQSTNPLRPACFACNAGSSIIYPHAGTTNFYTRPVAVNIHDCSVVQGVGGVAGDSISSFNGTPIPALEYIKAFFTGSTSGSIAAAQYDTTRFKNGTPYLSQQSSSGDSIGYYYTTDAYGQEAPIIPPPQSGAVPLPPGLNQFGSNTNGGPFPDDYNAWITAQPTVGGVPQGPTQQQVYMAAPTQGMPGSAIVPAYYDRGNASDFDQEGFGTDQANAWYVSTVINNPEKIKWKQFNREQPMPGETPSTWNRQKSQ